LGSRYAADLSVKCQGAKLLNEDEFYLKVAYALSGCQLVEQELKLYISQALELVRKCVGRRMSFNMSGEDYENASLERLIGTFKKLTSNQELVKELDKFKSERNFLSHKGISHCLDYEGDYFHSIAENFQKRLDAIKVEAKRLQIVIHDEANKFRGYLYFEEFPENE
jgi:hypothetical protein